MELTNDAEYLAIAFYKVYKDRLKNDYSKPQSKYFHDAEVVHKEHFSELKFEDFMDSIRELSRNEYVKCAWASNIFAEMLLTDKLIYDMENRFKNNFDEVLERLTKLKKLII